MGLAISRSVVAAHPGRMWATRNDARGLTLHIQRPVTADVTGTGRVGPERACLSGDGGVPEAVTDDDGCATTSRVLRRIPSTWRRARDCTRGCARPDCRSGEGRARRES